MRWEAVGGNREGVGALGVSVNICSSVELNRQRKSLKWD